MEGVLLMCGVVADSSRNELLYLLMEQGRIKKQRRWWVRDWIARREAMGPSNELRVHPEDYKEMLRMSSENFDALLEKVYPHIVKMDTSCRLVVCPKLKLDVTLRYLATGDSFKSLNFLFRLPKTTISKFLPKTLQAIKLVLDEYFQVPKSKEQWATLQEGFYQRWDFAGCMGALDGKHVAILRPPTSGLLYYNYKNFYSIILMALVDHDYCFTYIDIGAKGRCADGGVWNRSLLARAIGNNWIELPPNSVIVGDDAFPLKLYLITPCKKRNLSDEERMCDYRFSRARRVSENAFGILVSRLQVLKKPIALKNLNTVDDVVAVFCLLHNWLKKCNPTYLTSNNIDHEDTNGHLIEGSWRANVQNSIHDLQKTREQHASVNAERIRNKYCQYFNGEGAVIWQRRSVGL